MAARAHIPKVVTSATTSDLVDGAYFIPASTQGAAKMMARLMVGEETEVGESGGRWGVWVRGKHATSTNPQHPESRIKDYDGAVDSFAKQIATAGNGFGTTIQSMRARIKKWKAEGSHEVDLQFYEDTIRRYEEKYKGKRGNPDSSSAAMFESFHGEPSQGIVEFEETEHYHGHLAELGVMVGLKVRTVAGEDVTLGFDADDADRSSNPKTKLDLILDRVKPGKHEVTIDVRDYTEAQKKKVIHTAEARGLHAASDGKHILIRDLSQASNPFWPFDGSFSRTTIYHIGSGTPQKYSAVAEHKGHKIYKTGQGEYVIPAMDRESRFESLKEAKRFAGAWKANPSSSDPEESRIEGSIREGEMILRSGRTGGGRKMSAAELSAVRRAVDNSKKRLAELREEHDARWGAGWRCNPKRGPFGSAFSLAQKGISTLTDRGPIGEAYEAAGKVGGYLDRKLGRVLNPQSHIPTTLAKAKTRLSYTRSVLNNEALKAWKPPNAAPAWSTEGITPSYGNDRFRVYFYENENGTVFGSLYRTPPKHSNPSDDSYSGDAVLLTSNEEGTQLYLVGGDQSLDLSQLKLTEKDSTVIGEAWGICYHTRKDFDDFKPTDYCHTFGDEKAHPRLRRGADIWEDAKPPEKLFGTGELPVLIYDSLNQKLSLSGGVYRIEQPLMGTSPGIED